MRAAADSRKLKVRSVPVGHDTLFAKANNDVPGEVRLKMHVKKDDVSDELIDEGMDGSMDAKKEPKVVLVTVVYGGETFLREVTLSYTAKVGKTGKAKVTPGSVDD